MYSADLMHVFEATLAAKDAELARLQHEVERLQIQADHNEWTVAAFATSLGVAKEVSAALMATMAMPAGGEFELVQSLAGRTQDIEEKLRAGKLVERVAGMLSKGADKLDSAEAATGAELNKKFADSGEAWKGEMGFGGMKEYFGGKPETTNLPCP